MEPNLVEITANTVISVLEKNLAAPDDQFKYEEVLAKLMLHKDYRDVGSFGNLHMESAIDHYTAKRVGDMSEGLVALHGFLVKHGATAKSPYDFGHADRYGVAFANEEDFKTMAFQTQNYTYMIVLVKAHWYSGEKFESNDCWTVHLRYATTGKYTPQFARPEFGKLKFLNDRVKSGAKKYDDGASSYFRYHDFRDQGYICSVTHELCGPNWDTEGTIHGYSMLKSVFFDVSCHISMIDEYEKEE
jgi:hypothetical protein